MREADTPVLIKTLATPPQDQDEKGLMSNLVHEELIFVVNTFAVRL
jgi:hypothetical protein